MPWLRLVPWHGGWCTAAACGRPQPDLPGPCRWRSGPLTLPSLPCPPVAAALNGALNMWTYHGHNTFRLLVLFLMHNGGTWLIIYSLHSRMVWKWGVAMLALAALTSVRLPSLPCTPCLPLARPLSQHPQRRLPPLLPPLLPGRGPCCRAASGHSQQDMCFHHVTPPAAPAPSVHVQLGASKHVCLRLFEVDGAEETLAALHYVLSQAQ